MPMLPKSLVIAVLSGVAASGALGAYFLNLEAQQYELKFVEGPAVSLTVEKRDHKLGEKVTIRMINSGTERITFLDNVPTLHIRALDGTVFYSTMIDSKGLETTVVKSLREDTSLQSQRTGLMARSWTIV
jgi:hypothetical protein